jgi:DNA-binding response OmpR family regulator
LPDVVLGRDNCPLPVVLVVENDILERVFKAATLRRQGFEVFEAADVAGAVTVLKKIAVDILVSDVSLIDGMALARLAQEHQPTMHATAYKRRPAQEVGKPGPGP